MKKIILFLIICCVVKVVTAGDSVRRVVVLGSGVTGTWSAAKIAENLNEDDELILISESEEEGRQKLADGIISNNKTSAFIPIGIQIEFGAVFLSPPTRGDVEDAQHEGELGATAKLYVVRDLDESTKSKLDTLVDSANDVSVDKESVVFRYHHDVCYKGWREYMTAGGLGVSFPGTVVLSANIEALEQFRGKIIKNREGSDFEIDNDLLRVVTNEELMEMFPYYSKLIKDNQVNGLIGLRYDGLVTDAGVMTTLSEKIQSSNVSVKNKHGYIEGLEYHCDNLGRIVVTGVKLRDGEIIKADVIVSALGCGTEAVLKSVGIHLPILKKWGIVYALPQGSERGLEDRPVVIMRGLGIVRDVSNAPINFGVGGWILSDHSKPDPKRVLEFVKQSAKIWGVEDVSQEWIDQHNVSVQPRSITIDGLPVLDSNTRGLIILNPVGSLGNTQAPGSAYFAASKVLEQLGREIPEHLKLSESVDWKHFELSVNRF